MTALWVALALRYLVGDRWCPLVMLNSLIYYWFVPLALAIPVALLCRARWLVVWSVKH